MNKPIQVTTEFQHFTNNTAKQQQQNWSLAWYWSPHTYSYDLRHKKFRQIFETEMSRALAIACTLHDWQVTFSPWECQWLRLFFETKIFVTKTLCIDMYLSHPGNGGDDPHQPEDGGEEDHRCLSPCHLFIHHNHFHYSRHPCCYYCHHPSIHHLNKILITGPSQCWEWARPRVRPPCLLLIPPELFQILSLLLFCCATLLWFWTVRVIMEEKRATRFDFSTREEAWACIDVCREPATRERSALFIISIPCHLNCCPLTAPINSDVSQLSLLLTNDLSYRSWVNSWGMFWP